MPKLILKSPYIKCGGDGSIGGYMRYIATRERVELIADDRPPTKRQTQLIQHLLHDFPDTKELLEYADWIAAPTKAHASALITTALECNWSKAARSEVYMKYIATRPRVERLGSHGLFGEGETVDLQKTMTELDSYKGNVWTHIISLKQEDAARLGYDHANAWRGLLRMHRNEIAKAMSIPPEHFRWYAAFHDEGDHPHVHMMAWSSKSGDGWLNQDGIQTIRSKLTNDIFKQEMLHLYEQKTVSRDELVQEARSAMAELIKEMRVGICNHPEAERLMQKLSMQLETVTGKKQYGYLPKSVKDTVNQIVDQMERLPLVSECYKRWMELQGKVDSYYNDQPRERLPLSQQKDFRGIKNAVIQEAEHIRMGEFTFEDRGIDDEDEPKEDPYCSVKFWDLREIVYDEESSAEEIDEALKSMEALAEDGDMHAQYFMGKLWLEGRLAPPSMEGAAEWFEDAAMQGNFAAQYMVAKLYLSDDPEVHDAQRGMYWMKKCADADDGYAAYRLGKEYLSGKNTLKDVGMALKYLQQSAEDGNRFAQYTLGKLCLTGEDVRYDKDTAMYWMGRAAGQEHEYAQFFVHRQDTLQPPNVMLSASRLLHHMSRIFQNNSLPKSSPNDGHIDRKRLKRLQEKRIALGHKPDDHPDYGMTMSW